METNPRFQLTIGDLPGKVKLNWQFKLVEIEPLIAFQIHLDPDRAARQCALLGRDSPLDKVLEVCLPHGVQDVPCTWTPDPASTQTQGGATFESENLNLRILGAGPIGPDDTHKVFIAGIAFGESSRLVQVVEFERYCYLKNGFHRAYGLHKAGLTHIPCILLKGNTYADTGALDGAFPRSLLQSQNPPLCAHFTNDLAYPVTLRSARRVLKVNWSERFRLE